MDFETVIFFSTKHPVDHYILKWQPPFVLVRGQSISILAKPVGRLEYWIIAYDATGSQYQSSETIDQFSLNCVLLQHFSFYKCSLEKEEKIIFVS